MFADLIRRLTQASPETLPDADARIAIGAVLVRLARSDGDYSPVEIARIDAILATRYGLSDPAPLRAQCEALEAEAPDTVRFTRAIKDAVPYDERVGVIEALWQVVLADGRRSDEENALLRLVASLLGVTDTDSHMARQRVARDS